ncbi:MAG: hypothetical protein HQM11_01915 [SAR324 cluster bacterium]|nr:hypothetical protein [SAR324 cluster bacterium]
MKFQKMILTLLISLIPFSVWAIGCKDLDTQEKIQAFVKQSKESNPLLREKLSAHLRMSPCEGQECAAANLAIRTSKIERAHIVQDGGYKRVNFVQGKTAPQCVVSRGERSFLCAECEIAANTECTSFQANQSSSTIRGTNIDTDDFKLLDDPNYESVCEEQEKAPEYVKITTRKKAGDSQYELVIAYYHKQKKVPVLISYYISNVMRKVYRFFPQFYYQISGEWMATVVRVRSTQGNEENYVFETQIDITKDASGKYQVYLDMKQDPVLQTAGSSVLFLTD